MLRKTTASALTVDPAIEKRMRDGSDGKSAFRFAPFRAVAQLHLAARAEVGRAAGDDDPLHDPVAILAGARFALAGVDEEALLHPALLAAPVAVVVDRGAARVDPRFQRRHHPVAE